MREYKHILVVVRMIQSCRKAIQYGVSLARKYGAELYVIHSVYNPIGLKGWGLGTRELVLEYEKGLKNSRLKLSAIIEAEKTQGMSIKELIREGPSTEKILKKPLRKKKSTCRSCLATKRVIWNTCSSVAATRNWSERCPVRSCW
jgi:universal stress protein A